MIRINDVNPKLEGGIEIRAPKELGVTAKIWLQERARKLEEYNWQIDCWQVGKDKSGTEIAIDRLGRFLFGVPGYDGHLRVVAQGKMVTVYYPLDPPEVGNLIMALKKQIEEETEDA